MSKTNCRRLAIIFNDVTAGKEFIISLATCQGTDFYTSFHFINIFHAFVIFMRYCIGLVG